MLATSHCIGLAGIDGYPVRVEVDLSSGLPAFETVGLPDAAVKESRERVRSALRNSGLNFPVARITVNLAPADTRKEGPSFDLPIAVAILAASGVVPSAALEGVALLGELSLDGAVRPVRGGLSAIISARACGFRAVILPEQNAHEGCCIEGIEVYAAQTLRGVVDHMLGQGTLPRVEARAYRELLLDRPSEPDLCMVRGQKSAKRALEIAAAGGHNLLMVGPPGSGKTMLARCLPTILPDMTFEEALVATRIHSVAGLISGGLLTQRPFRAPHHTASTASLVGGGKGALPGEISKAHHGVLFLDELPEYKRDVLEALRQPLEDGFVTVTRVSAQTTYPSRFILVCAMNPCPCGNYGSRTKQCTCAHGDIRRYLSRISGPLLDRVDMHMEVESVPLAEMVGAPAEENSAIVRARVNEARARQQRRYMRADGSAEYAHNAQLDAKGISRHCPLTKDAQQLLSRAVDSMGFSARGYARIIKVARTIADLEDTDIKPAHIAEAVQYRSLDQKYWG